MGFTASSVEFSPDGLRRGRRWGRAGRIGIAFAVAGLLGACLEIKPVALEGSAGDMSSRNYGQSEPIERVTASGATRVWSDYSGEFVWAEYAAPWCGTSPRQSGEMRALASFPEVRRVTVLTSETGGYGHPATQATAASWAARFGLDPEHVVAANLSHQRVPRHILFSPEGHCLYDEVGFLSASQVEELLRQRVADWQRWKATGELAPWMR